MKIVFMGTPDFAVPTLEMLIEEGHKIELVVTQPDKPKGRGNKQSFSPIKEVAIKHNLPVGQPTKLRNNTEFLEIIKNIAPDLIVVVAFGQILPKEILELPPLGCINIHGSILPKYRGAAPIQWAVIDGEHKTGVTIMYMDEGLDTGDMLYKKEIEILEEDNSGTLFEKMSELGKEALKEALPAIISGGKQRIPQQHENATIAPRITKSLGKIDFNLPATVISNLIKGLYPWPIAFIEYKDMLIKIHKACVVEEDSEKRPGTIVKVDKDGIMVQTSDKMLLLTEIQVPNKKKIAVSEYIKGNVIEEGYVL
ncbi:MAG: methionyl-tRNA formyltransferase [Epulopiscium sp. Nuni2H_MBin003]|nr:MAG: methionyl-tRNA formyltransferase [Epulopiscium sp. Nuni2H_MBin003]